MNSSSRARSSGVSLSSPAALKTLSDIAFSTPGKSAFCACARVRLKASGRRAKVARNNFIMRRIEDATSTLKSKQRSALRHQLHHLGRGSHRYDLELHQVLPLVSPKREKRFIRCLHQLVADGHVRADPARDVLQTRRHHPSA